MFRKIGEVWRSEVGKSTQTKPKAKKDEKPLSLSIRLAIG
jgi:hypothetical protein